MKKNALMFILVAGLLAVAAVAYVLRPPAEASAPIEAVPLSIETETPIETAEVVESEPEPTAVESLDTTAEQPQTTTSGNLVYAISQQDSEVRFKIDELLRNIPTTAVGVSNQIAGEIAIDFDNPANSQVGQITINARTLETDNRNRNRMIQNEILDTADFEFITFTPTSITGLPPVITHGESVTLQITGDLTIRSITVPVTFDVTASVDTNGQLAGSAIATVLRSDYDLVIPSVPSVADVSDEVIIEFDFVANPK